MDGVGVASTNPPWLMFTLWFLAKQMFQLLSMLIPRVCFLHLSWTFVNIDCEVTDPLHGLLVPVLTFAHKKISCLVIKSCIWLCSASRPPIGLWFVLISTLCWQEMWSILIHQQQNQQPPPTCNVWSAGISGSVCSSLCRLSGSNNYELWLNLKQWREGLGLYCVCDLLLTLIFISVSV